MRLTPSETPGWILDIARRHDACAVPHLPPVTSSSLESYEAILRSSQKHLHVAAAAVRILDLLRSASTHPVTPEERKAITSFIDAYDSGDETKIQKHLSKIMSNRVSDFFPSWPQARIAVKHAYMAIRDQAESAFAHQQVKMTGQRRAAPAPAKTRVGNALHEIGLHLQDGIPLDKIFWILKKNGFQPLQEDGTAWDGMILGGKECGDPAAADQHVVFPLAIQVEDGSWQLSTSTVSLSWCTKPMAQGDRYEIVAYIS